MMPTTIEWIEKAEEDFEAASILAQSRSERQLNTICFHCQQSAEKYLKAIMQEHGMYVPYIHNLSDLLDKVVSVLPMFESHRQSCLELTPFATVFRYPGLSTSRDDAKRALKQCANIRIDVRRHFGLES